MKNIRIENVSKSYNSCEGDILKDFSLTIPAGKFFALLGPSGCGKTTLLRLIAGFEKVNGGNIYLGNQNITDIPINERRINTVFQNYALFPHLTVFDNVAYGLSVKDVPKDIIKDKVVSILRAVRLESQMSKKIGQLSGGQQQRVALARAIVNEPDVLLLDEPLAALDFKLREKLLIELIELQDKFKMTFVYVTHDQLEALTVADQMAIMNYNGKIEQIGTPKEIYEFPVSTFVARFVGSTNIFHGILKSNNPEVDVTEPDVSTSANMHTSKGVNGTIEIKDLGTFEVFIPDSKKWLANGEVRALSLRPEKILITKKPTEGFSNMLEGIVHTIVYHGRSTQYNMKLKNGMMVQVFEQNEEHFPHEVIDYDNHVYLYWQKENVVILER